MEASERICIRPVVIIVSPTSIPDNTSICSSFRSPVSTGTLCAFPFTSFQTLFPPISGTIASVGNRIECSDWLVIKFKRANIPADKRLSARSHRARNIIVRVSGSIRGSTAYTVAVNSLSDASMVNDTLELINGNPAYFSGMENSTFNRLSSTRRLTRTPGCR